MTDSNSVQSFTIGGIDVRVEHKQNEITIMLEENMEYPRNGLNPAFSGESVKYRDVGDFIKQHIEPFISNTVYTLEGRNGGTSYMTIGEYDARMHLPTDIIALPVDKIMAEFKRLETAYPTYQKLTDEVFKDELATKDQLDAEAKQRQTDALKTVAAFYADQVTKSDPKINRAELAQTIAEAKLPSHLVTMVVQAFRTPEGHMGQLGR